MFISTLVKRERYSDRKKVFSKSSCKPFQNILLSGTCLELTVECRRQVSRMFVGYILQLHTRPCLNGGVLSSSCYVIVLTKSFQYVS